MELPVDILNQVMRDERRAQAILGAPLEPLVKEFDTRATIGAAIISTVISAGEFGDESAAELAIDSPPPHLSDQYDFAVAMFPLAKPLRTSPIQLAARANKNSAQPVNSSVDTIEAVGPYVNVGLHRPAVFNMIIASALASESVVGNNSMLGDRVVVDYSSPNMAKRLGLQHIPSTFAGESISRILEASGAKVVRANHVGDHGTPFGRVLVGWKKYGDRKEFEKDPVGHMHALYVRVNKETKTNPDLAQEARDEFMALEQGDSQNTKIWEMMRAANIAENDALYKSIGVKFDTTIGESSYVSSGQAIVGELIAKGIAQIGEDDSVYIPSTDDSTLPLVIRKADGSSLYGTRDLAAIRHRVNTLGATSIKYVVGAEQASYFDTIFAVARQAGILPDASDAKHVKIGLLLNGDGKKVSSRSGEATSFQSVLDNAITSAQHYVQAVGHDISPAEVMDLAKKFGLGSVAFGVLGNDISKNSVVPCEVKPDDASIYAQTTHARANQIIEQSRGFTGTQAEGGDFEYQHPDEWLLAKALMEVPAAVAKAAEQDGPHHVASALQIVASAFNKMYRNPELRIIDRQLQTVSRSRWALSEVTRATLHDGLRLLAIEVPDKI